MMKRGFTLVETLVSIAILFTVISGAYAAVQTGISGSVISRQEVTAYYLAQEEMELLRNQRDENGLTGQNWLTGIAANSSDPCYFGRLCYGDAIAGPPFLSCTTGTPDSCPAVRTDSANGLYGYNAAWALTSFTRYVTLTAVGADEVQVAVVVTWPEGQGTRTFKIRENLFNWQ